MGFGVQDLGLGGFRVWGLGFRLGVSGLELGGSHPKKQGPGRFLRDVCPCDFIRAHSTPWHLARTPFFGGVPL